MNASKQEAPEREEIEALLPRFVGVILQTPPTFSAIRIDGARAYDLAREGESFQIQPRPINVYRLSLISAEPDAAVLEAECGKGAYVRAIARDLGRALGCYGHVIELRRTRVGPFSADAAIGLDRLPDDLYQHRLFDETFVCILRSKHPRIGKTLSLAQFASEWHLVVGRYESGSDTFFRSADGNLVRELARKGVDRKIAMRVPDFLAVPHIIASTDLLCVVPRQLADVYAAYGQVRLVALPVRGESFRVGQFWHKRFDSDQGNNWLRGVIRELFEVKGHGKTKPG